MTHPQRVARVSAMVLLLVAFLPRHTSVFADANEGVEGFANSEATISAGGTHTCAVLSNGSAMCWGSNKYQELGDRLLTLNRSTPLFVSGIDGSSPQSSAVAISSGEYHTCALLKSGAISCWGYNIFGQLGDGTTTSRVMPATVVGIDGSSSAATAIAVSSGSVHTCAVLVSGAVMCWGNNSIGRLGNGAADGDSSIPVPVLGIDGSADTTSAVAISVGSSHTCAVMRRGTILCWGYSSSGELGDQTTADRPTPVQVAGIDGVDPPTSAIAVSVGSSHSCAVMRDGRVKCWGYNAYGKLGDATTLSRSAPVAVSGLDGKTDAFTAVAVSAGDAHTCAVLKSGRAVCWGYNAYGELGNSNTANSSVPVAVSDIDGATGASSAVAISVGVSHTCAVLRTGHATCWGFNGTGELGDDSIENRSTPREVSGLSLIAPTTPATIRSSPVGPPATAPSTGQANGWLNGVTIAIVALAILSAGRFVSNLSKWSDGGVPDTRRRTPWRRTRPP